MSKYFRLEEAERLLPELERTLRGIIAAKEAFDGVKGELRAFSERIAMLGGAQVDRDGLASKRQRCETLAASVNEGIEAIQQRGCIIKDLNTGLLDFPTVFRGQEVLLCWKLGESSIEYWHDLASGFQGRKPIDSDFLREHGRA